MGCRQQSFQTTDHGRREHPPLRRACDRITLVAAHSVGGYALEDNDSQWLRASWAIMVNPEGHEATRLHPEPRSFLCWNPVVASHMGIPVVSASWEVDRHSFRVSPCQSDHTLLDGVGRTSEWSKGWVGGAAGHDVKSVLVVQVETGSRSWDISVNEPQDLGKLARKRGSDPLRQNLCAASTLGLVIDKSGDCGGLHEPGDATDGRRDNTSENCPTEPSPSLRICKTPDAANANRERSEQRQRLWVVVLQPQERASHLPVSFVSQRAGTSSVP